MLARRAPASRVKAANQLIAAGNIQLVAEAIVLLEAQGVDIEAAARALGGGLAGSAVLERKAPDMIARRFRPGFTCPVEQVVEPLLAGQAVQGPGEHLQGWAAARDRVQLPARRCPGRDQPPERFSHRRGAHHMQRPQRPGTEDRHAPEPGIPSPVSPTRDAASLRSWLSCPAAYRRQSRIPATVTSQDTLSSHSGAWLPRYPGPPPADPERTDLRCRPVPVPVRLAGPVVYFSCA